MPPHAKAIIKPFICQTRDESSWWSKCVVVNKRPFFILYVGPSHSIERYGFPGRHHGAFWDLHNRELTRPQQEASAPDEVSRMRRR